LENELIKSAQKGDIKAFETLVRQYQQRVTGLAVTIVGSRSHALDVAQETFIRVYRFLPSFNTRKNFFTWLYKITVNCSYDFLKREKKYRALPLETIPPAQHTGDQTDSFLMAEMQEKIHELLDTLSVPQKTAFILRDVHGFSCRETAHIMDCPSGTVRSHLHFARKRLRTLVKSQYPEFLEGIVS